MQLSEFNAAPAHTATSLLLECAKVPRWAATLTAGRPYPTVGELTARAGELAFEWDAADVDAALAEHPRIGERAEGQDAAAQHSRREQSRAEQRTVEETARLAAGNAAYEAKFGRVFLIRAAGRSAAEILDQLNERLGNDPDTESAVAAEQLGEIALLRLKAAVADG